MSTDSASRFSSLDAALRHHHLPPENDAQIRGFITELGVTEFYDRGSYIKAVRPGGGLKAALQIHYGYTTGFASEDEAQMASEGVTEVWRSGRGKGLWGVSHHTNQLREGNGSSAVGNQGAGPSCPECNLVLPATGRCDNCD